MCKGKKDVACNRTACNETKAVHYNQAMNAYYCHECAVAIKKYEMKGDNPIFPNYEAETEEWIKAERLEMFGEEE